MQKTNLFTFNSSNTHKKYLLFALIFYVSFLISFLLLIINPSVFYWRAWEYFDEIGFCIPNKLKWKGYEFGDAARKYLYSFQDKWRTEASVDEEGFRSVPFNVEKFPILFVGDSNTWGCGLSDSETIPWSVATKLNVPVFNGGRIPFTLSKILNNPRLKETKIIVELLTQHLVNKYIFNTSDFNKKDYEIYAQEKKSITNYFKVPPNRFFIPLKLIRSTFFKFNFLNEFTKSKIDAYQIGYNNKVTLKCKDADFATAIEKIQERARYLESLGYNYVVTVIPSKNMQLGYIIDPTNLEQEKTIVEKLAKANVHYIDLCKVYRNFGKPRFLYFRSDNHINGMGAELIAREVAAYLSKNFSEICQNYSLSH